MRKVCYVTGTRAEFGLMCRTLRRLHRDPDIDLSICVTAMHLSKQFGHTIDEIIAEKFRICATLPVDIDECSNESMSKAIGHEILGFTDIFLQERPQIVLVLGDRGESLAAVIAAIHLNIHVIHIHGGERSGTVDEMVRHAISKFAHYHFVATEASRERLIKMGELPETVFVTCAPGLDGITEDIHFSKQQLFNDAAFDLNKTTAIAVFHPVVQEVSYMANQTANMMEALASTNHQIICLMPNADAGGLLIREVLETYRSHPLLRLHTHIERDYYLAWFKAADYIIGNSSSAIIEAASFLLPVVNIGSRQNCRERSENTVDCEPTKAAILAAIDTALTRGKAPCKNIYGDGYAGQRILDLLKNLPLPADLLRKCNAY